MTFKKIIQIVAIILCLSILNITFANASVNTAELSQNKNSAQSISSDSVSVQAKTVGKKYLVMLPFVFIHSEASIFSSFGVLVYGQKVVVLSNSRFYSYVKTESGTTGYVFSGFLGENLRINKSLTVPAYACAYVGKTSPTKIIADYDGSGIISWTVSDSSILSFDQKTGTVTGLKPGVAKITASAGLFQTDECIVSVINQWKETETAKAQNQITIRNAPGDNYNARITIKKDTSITARGDLADGSGWIYISAKNNEYWGFIKVSDFPGIDYLMTQYHYYDNGFNTRFGSASDKIYDYASVLNDVMMDLFKLKVCPYVGLYTSAADSCKIMSSGSVTSSNLSKACPKNGSHKSNSCLTTGNLREELKNTYGNGGGIVSKTAWTGHIMTSHEADRSNATVGIGTIIFTPYGAVNPNTYTNYSKTKIREENIYTLVHETGHQFGLGDHYCSKDMSAITGKCSNTYCSDCYGIDAKGCIMLERFNVENVNVDTLYCSKCTQNINNCLSNIF